MSLNIIVHIHYHLSIINLRGVANWGLEAAGPVAHLSSVAGPLIARQDLAHTMGSEWLCK